jgi:hypothetical protein
VETTMETLELQLDERTLARVRQLAEYRRIAPEDLIQEMVARAVNDPFLGMLADEPELIDRVTEEAMQTRELRSPIRPPVFRPAKGPSTARSLLQYAGTWEGDDLEECLRLVYATRSKAKF